MISGVPVGDDTYVRACIDRKVGTALEQARTAADVLAAADRIAPPRPPYEQAHLAQDVHQVKRQQLASNALSRLRNLLIGSGASAARRAALRDARMARLASCAAQPSCQRADGADEHKDVQSARMVAQSLQSLATLCAADTADAAAGGAREGVGPAAKAAAETATDAATFVPLREAALLLSSRAEALQHKASATPDA